MKYFILFLSLLCSSIFGQHYGEDIFECVTDNESPIDSNQGLINNLNGSDCGNTSIWWQDYPNTNSPYLPSIYDPLGSYDNLYIRLNIVILQKDDGSGNFSQTNLEHQLFFQDAMNHANYLLANMILPGGSTIDCPPLTISDTKLRFIPNYIYIQDTQLWDTLNSSLSGGLNLGSWFPGSSTFYLNTLDIQISNDPSIPKGINIYLTQESLAYTEYVSNQNFLPADCARCENLTPENSECYLYDLAYCNTLNCEKEEPVVSEYYSNAASHQPDFNDFSKSLRIHYPNVFTKYSFKKNHVANNPNYYCEDTHTWEEVRGWAVGEFALVLIHEIGHSLNLGHENECTHNFMDQGTSSNRYFFGEQLARIYRALSLSNARQMVTEDSHNGNCIVINDVQKWDVDIRLYSNIVIENGGELKLTCKLILPPNSQIIVRNGGKLIIEGGEILSADGENWDGIRNEATGYTLINPDTEFIASEEYDYFISYSDASSISCPVLTKTIPDKLLDDYSVIELSEIEKNSIEFYPNPSQNIVFYIISDKEWIGSQIEVYDYNNNFIFKSKLTDETGSIDLSIFKSGIYYFRIINLDGKRISNKIIKK